MIELSDLKYVNASMRDNINEKILQVIDSNSFVDSQYVYDFEKEFSEYLGARYCISVGNGTDALEIAISCLSLPIPSEIIIPDCTFIATAEAVVNTGHIPIIADVKDDFTIDPDSIECLITERTGAIICVHLYGNPCDMDNISEIAKSHNIHLIEDVAQAHGSRYKGKRVGVFSDLGCFSFYPSKILGAYGDAGAIITNSDYLAQKILQLRNHGRQGKNNHVMFGRNSKMDSIQAVVLSEKLKQIDNLIKKRREDALIYDSKLANIESISTIYPMGESSYYQYAICSNQRDRIIQYLADNGIECGVYYKKTISQFPFVNSNEKYDTYRSRELFSKVLSLPIGIHIDEKKQRYIIDKLRAFRP